VVQSESRSHALVLIPPSLAQPGSITPGPRACEHVAPVARCIRVAVPPSVALPPPDDVPHAEAKNKAIG
ncbi:hypothetical protein, partial [Klebsiella pneumoniae]|uniref:hypothetical protein n=1 Tax=Klebsiella pneumoniae TaxID=573 RepID=UPI003EE39E9F